MSKASFLSTNDRVVKLWSEGYKQRKSFSKCKIEGDELKLPQSQVSGEGFQAKLKAEFRGCHSYNINSLSVAPDEECFLSADDLRINMWSFKDPNLAYNVIDLKPPHLEELQEVITHVEYHP